MKIPYKITYTKRKSLALIIKNNGEVHVRAPKSRLFDSSLIEKFVLDKKDWIISNVEKIKSNLKDKRPELPEAEKKKKRKEAREVIFDRVNYYAEKYNFKYSKLRLSSAKTRWGSCSSSDTISINWNLIFAPIDIMDYVIIHELCHLRQHNHSDKFWREVEKYIPDYKNKRKWLKDNEHKLQ